MAKNAFSSIPNAPKRVGFWASRRLARLGRRDVKRYQNMQDTTATHTIKALEAQTHLNQRKVNEWLVRELTPLRAGNKSLSDQVIGLDARIAAYEADLGPTGRIRKANTVRLNALRQQRLNALGQRAANLATGRALIEIAGEAADTWTRYFEAQAAIYVRARALKNKLQPPAAMAAVPTIENVELPPTPDFDYRDDWTEPVAEPAAESAEEAPTTEAAQPERTN